MTRAVAILATVVGVAPLPFHSHVSRVSPAVRAEVKAGGAWHRGCPVGFDDLRVLTVSHFGFDHQVHAGELLTNRRVVQRLRRVFLRLYHLRFPIRHMTIDDAYGRHPPADGDVSGSFECRQAVASPCTSVKRVGNGSWSNHAYGLAVDLNPVENPYVGCGQSRDPKARSYRNRRNVRPGMVTPAVVRAFRSIGWGWGGGWAGDTKDYMHFSFNGH